MQEVLNLTSWREHFHDPMDRTLLAYSEKITFTPEQLTRGDLNLLRDGGYSEKQVLDIVLVTAYRHYITRIANGTGIEIGADRVERSILSQYTYAHDSVVTPPSQIGELPGDGATIGQVLESADEGFWVESPDLSTVGANLERECQQWEQRIGFVPNWLRAISRHEASAVAASEFALYCTFGGSPLGSSREHLIGCLVASLLRTPYFYCLHGSFLKEQETFGELLVNVEGWREADLSEQDQVLLDFSEQMTRNAHQVTQEKVDRLKATGFSESEVLDVIVLTSFLNCFCRVANALGVPLDPASKAFYEECKPAFMSREG
ncbi:MAG: hypothetical protein V3R94_11505 [Acidobacteriota bacterium]